MRKDFNGNVIGKISLTKLFTEWKNEAPDENYYEPRENWYLKKCEIYNNGLAACLFESTECNKNYYRLIIGTFESEKFKYKYKFRFCRNSAAVYDFGMTDQGIVYLEQDSGKKDIYSCTVTGEGYDLPEPDELYTRSENITAVTIGCCLYFLFIPELKNEKTAYEVCDAISSAKPDDDDDDFDDDNDNNGKDDISDVSKSVAAKIQSLKSGNSEGPDASERLNKLIGLEGIKQKIHELKAYVRMQKRMEKFGKKPENICCNMVFTGNPGTAKTTVARLVAEILHDEGVIKTDKFMEVGRSDLVAVYLGQTAVKTKKVFRDIKGGVLFIDEAYSLCDGCDNGYGSEALATIVQEMENNRDTVVIFAGYPDKMEELFEVNPGLRSRVPIKLHFDDYSLDELTAITELEAERKGFIISDEAKKNVRTICAEAMKEKDFGNGRFCRLLIESAELKHALSISDRIDKVNKAELFTLGPDDFEIPAVLSKDERNIIQLGFCA